MPRPTGLRTSVIKLPTGETAQWLWVTPEMAQDILDKWNPHNRPLSKTNTTKIQTSMKRGEYMQLGDPIRFGVSGKLLDGQHRLTAIAKSGTGQWILVVRNIPDELFPLIDGFKPRNGGDCIGIATGAANPKQTACAIQMVLQYHRTQEFGGYGSVRVNNPELVTAWLTKIDQEYMSKVVTVACRVRTSFKSVGILAALGYLLGPTHFDIYESIATDLHVDKKLPHGDAVRTMKQKMADWGTMSPSKRELCALLVKMANARVQDRKMFKLQWTSAEGFPKLVGIYTVDFAA